MLNQSARASNGPSRGRRLFAMAPLNMTAIRSGQFWEPAGEEQLADYVENLQPKLMRGMQHLAEHPAENGALSLRTMTNLDANGAARRETSVPGYFLALDHLEAWAKRTRPISTSIGTPSR